MIDDPGMRRFGFSLAVESFSPGRAIVLTAIAILLAAADWLPDNPYLDPDRLAFALTAALGVAALGIALRARARPGVIARWRNRIILLVFTFASLGLAGEFATRWIFRDVTTSADFRDYFSRRWTRTNGLLLNASDFRERDFMEAKAPGTYRIAVVGDSLTFGNGIRQQDRYSDLVQAHLPTSIEVLNFGLPGSNTQQHLNRIARLVPRVHPDFILLQWYVNDFEGNDLGRRPLFKPLMPNRGIHDWLRGVSALYAVTNLRWVEIQVSAGITRSYEAHLRDRLGDPNSHGAQVERGLLLDLISLCRRAGVPIGIVLFPDISADLGPKYPFAYLHERVLDLCHAQGLTCLDLRNDFAAVKDRRQLWVNRLDHHPSARANAIAAERILETFPKTWVTSPAR